MVELNETLEEAVVREVKEETGITAQVKGLLSFREVPGYMFGRNDLYFVFLMHAEKEGQEIVKQEDEISECEWVACKDFSDRAPYMSPMIQKMAPIFDSDKSVFEKVIEDYKEKSKNKEDALKLLSMTNKTYQFRNRNNHLYLGKFLRECIKYGSKI